MMKVRRVESLALLVGMIAAEAMGSGVGGSYFVPSTPVPSGPVANCAPGGRAPIAGCSTCKRLGFACVDHASPAPCTPEGNCRPTGPFGFATPHWRRWPGTDDGGPSPEPAPAPGSLIPRYEEPAPYDEDQQAPPSLDEATNAAETGDDGEGNSERPSMNRPEMNRPGLELTLPPMPRPSLPSSRPGANQAPENNNNAAPPSLPFGYAPPAGAVDAYGPPTPAFENTTPTSLPKAEAGKRDLPPPLPVGFTQNGISPAPRRLPTTFGRPAMETPHFDTAIQPASANLPIQR